MGTPETLESSRPQFQTQRRVEFRDTDAAGIVHFSAFFPMMESAEHEFLRSIGVAVMPPHDAAERITWPRVSAACDYRGPARFEEVLDLRLYIERIGDSSITYRFEISCEDRPVAVGRITVVCCRLESGGKLTKTSVPEPLRERLLGSS